MMHVDVVCEDFFAKRTQKMMMSDTTAAAACGSSSSQDFFLKRTQKPHISRTFGPAFLGVHSVASINKLQLCCSLLIVFWAFGPKYKCEYYYFGNYEIVQSTIS